MRFAAALATCLLATSAAAQQTTLEPSAAQACLTREGDKDALPEYPFAAFKDQQPGRVQVALRFTGPERRPAVTVLHKEGGKEFLDSFVESVETYVRAYRVPCHDGGAAPAELVFDFVFRPEDRRVHWSPPSDTVDPLRLAMLACVVHVSGDKGPGYPLPALRSGVQGRILARLYYEAPDRAPRAEVFGHPSAKLLSRQVGGWVEGYRMPCHQGAPVSVVMTFVFHLAGDAFGFKPGLTIRSLLPAVRNIQKQRIDFDFNRMACPFDVQFVHRMPDMANLVGEVGGHDAARRPFLDWLGQAQLDLPSATLAAVYGDTAYIHVPCMKINLNPQE